MNIIVTAISVLLATIILNFVFKKYQILIDQINYSRHKSFINGYKTIPLSGVDGAFFRIFFLIIEGILKKIFNKLSKKSILTESIKLSNKNRYITIMIIWNITLKVGVCKIFRSDNKPIKKIKKINIFKYL